MDELRFLTVFPDADGGLEGGGGSRRSREACLQESCFHLSVEQGQDKGAGEQTLGSRARWEKSLREQHTAAEEEGGRHPLWKSPGFIPGVFVQEK